MGMGGHVEIFPDPATLALYVAEWITAEALASKGPFRVSLSGGPTPKALYEVLGADPWRARFPWQRVLWFWGDERFVPYSHPESNYRMIREAMLANVQVPPENLYPVPVEGTPEEAALCYEQILQETYGRSVLDPEKPFFDISLLGLGPDGHTASLLPGEPVLQERQRWVAVVPHGRPEVRITMTYPVLESSRQAAFLVAGEEQAAVLAAIHNGKSGVPAARLRPVGRLLWFLDRAAASQTRL